MPLRWNNSAWLGALVVWQVFGITACQDDDTSEGTSVDQIEPGDAGEAGDASEDACTDSGCDDAAVSYCSVDLTAIGCEEWTDSPITCPDFAPILYVCPTGPQDCCITAGVAGSNDGGAVRCCEPPAPK